MQFLWSMIAHYPKHELNSIRRRIELNYDEEMIPFCDAEPVAVNGYARNTTCEWAV